MKNIWDAFYEKRGRYFLNADPNLSKLILKFKLFNVKKVLDIGCGSGINSIALAKEGFRVTGIDISKKAINLASKWADDNSLKINFQYGDISQALKFEDDSFDACLAIDSLSYSSATSCFFCIEEINRILKKRGFMYLVLPVKSSNRLMSHIIFSVEEIEAKLKNKFRIIFKSESEDGMLSLLAIAKE